jgi:hypothetical protein
MNKLPLVAVLCATMAAGWAGAEPLAPDDLSVVVSSCRAAMAKGYCVVRNSEPLPPEVRSIPWRLGRRLGTVSTGAFVDLQALDVQMCDAAEAACRADASSERCRLSRALWGAR